MISVPYVQAMAAYNAEMNRRLYAAAGRLSDSERRRDRGAFWSSIHATFNHLLWGDRMWMSRFDGWEAPPRSGPGGTALFDDFDKMTAVRAEDDRRIQSWAAALDAAWLGEDQTWFSGMEKRELTMPRTLLLMHFFNHQTHHRGQAHAMLTASGEKTGDTDLMLVVSVSPK